jgi:hypothetical protein
MCTHPRLGLMAPLVGGRPPNLIPLPHYLAAKRRALERRSLRSNTTE